MWEEVTPLAPAPLVQAAASVAALAAAPKQDGRESPDGIGGVIKIEEESKSVPLESGWISVDPTAEKERP
jgi:hypothetical protein